MHKLCGCKFILFLDPGGTGFQTINLWEKKNCIPMGMRGHNLPLCRFIHQLIAWNLTSLTVDPRSRLARRALLLYMLPQIYVTHGRMMMSVSYFSYVIDKWACRWHDRGDHPCIATGVSEVQAPTKCQPRMAQPTHNGQQAPRQTWTKPAKS